MNIREVSKENEAFFQKFKELIPEGTIVFVALVRECEDDTGARGESTQIKTNIEDWRPLFERINTITFEMLTGQVPVEDLRGQGGRLQ